MITRVKGGVPPSVPGLENRRALANNLRCWTKYKIEVEGRKARLYVYGAEQPCLIVNDLKLEPREGGVALWVGPGTEGYFSNLKIAAK